MKAFDTVEKLYNISNNNFLFREILIQNNIKLSNIIYSKLTNKNLKEKAIYIYNNLVKQKVKFINIFSNNYPNQLKTVLNAPLLICYFGDIKILNKKKVYIYKSIDHLKYTSIYNEVYNLENIICINQEKNNNSIIIIETEIYSENYVLPSKYISNNLYLLLPKLADNKYEILASITDYLLILNANYNKEILRLTCNILEFGKEILVVPR